MVLTSVQNEREWERLCARVLGRPELASDPRFATNTDRVANRSAIDAIIAEEIRRRGREETIARLTAAVIACGRLSDLDDLAAHPQNRFVRVETEGGGVELLSPGSIVAGIPEAFGPAPGLGQHGGLVRAEFSAAAPPPMTDAAPACDLTADAPGTRGSAAHPVGCLGVPAVPGLPDAGIRCGRPSRRTPAAGPHAGRRLLGTTPGGCAAFRGRPGPSRETIAMSFAGKTVLITGAGKGIGRATAILLAGRGARIVALSRTQADLDSLAAEIGGRSVAVDLADAEAARAAARAALPADLLVNCAGMNVLEPFLQMTVAAFDLVHAVNTRAAMIVAQEYARARIAAGGGGGIVNVSSMSSLSALPIMPPIAPRRAGSTR